MTLTLRRFSLSRMLFMGAILVLLLSVTAIPSGAEAPNDLIITGIIDGPLTGGIPKAVELYAVNDIPDLSIYGIGSANNGGGTDGEEFSFPADSVPAGECIYVATEADGFKAFFGFDPNYTDGSAVSINGDDAIELFTNGTVSDVFGDINTDGTGEPWDYLDGWAYRISDTGPDGSTFVLGNWTFSGTNALDGETSNATAATPFPIGTYAPCSDAPPVPDVFINELRINKSGAETDFFEIQGASGTSLDGLTYVVLSGEFSPGQIDYAIDLSSTSIPGDGFFVAGGANTAATYGITPDLGVEFDFFGSPTTHMIVSGFTGTAGDDLDTNNDGTLDTTPWTTVIDSVSLVDGDTNTDYSYSSAVVGPDGSFTPAGTYRCDDAPTGSFDNNQLAFGSATGTPGESNASLCVLPVTKIHEVQGAGSASPLVGQTVAIEGIVVGDFQDVVGANGDLNGFYVQEEDADADGNPLTSEGVFVFQGSNPTVDVAIGDHVRVEGPVSEYFGDTQITSFSGVTVNSSGNSLPAVSVLSLPVTDISDFEAYEGMYVTFPQPLVISEYFNYDRFGEIVLTDARHFQPTAVFDPGSTEAAELAVANSLARITLDDGLTSQNPDITRHPNGSPFGLANLFRGGDTVENVTGVINYAFGLYRVQPTQGADYTSVNPRTATPDPVGGNVSVASFNVLNYFTTLDDGVNDICGPAGDQECRGADDAGELARQRAKIIAALAAIDADVVGLMEIENHIGDVPTADLVSGLNDIMGAGTYDYIATGAMGSDAIRQAFIYKPAKVTPFGNYAVLDTPEFLDPNNTGSDKNRPALAQTFSVNSTGGVFTAVVNHLKSKGSGCGAGDDDPEAGSCNLTRTLSAQVLLNWLDTDPTGSGDKDFMIIGDLNSYDKEDPIDVLVAGGYTDLAYEYQGEYAYSYVFSGQWGYLDYALANAALLGEVTGATEWHINADEADLIDYDTTFKSPNQIAAYAPDAYRASDHDPVVVGLELTTEAEIMELIDDIQGLVDEGVLNEGQGNSFMSKLENVLNKLAKGQTKAAANQLGAFINEVEAFVNSGTFSAEQGDLLIQAAALLVDALT